MYVIIEGGMLRAAYDETGKEIDVDIFDVDVLKGGDEDEPGELRADWITRLELLPASQLREDVASWVEDEEEDTYQRADDDG